jgi:hypothetical protein
LADACEELAGRLVAASQHVPGKLRNPALFVGDALLPGEIQRDENRRCDREDGDKNCDRDGDLPVSQMAPSELLASSPCDRWLTIRNCCNGR